MTSRLHDARGHVTASWRALRIRTANPVSSLSRAFGCYAPISSARPFAWPASSAITSQTGASAMGLRHRSIRLRVGILIVVPVLCLIGLYGFAASITLGSALTQAHTKTLHNDLLNPVSSFQAALAQERHLALLSLAAPTSTQFASAVGMQENNTRKALDALRAAIASPAVADNATAGERQAITGLLSAAATLPALRGNVAAGAIATTTALADYDAIINSGYTVLDQAIGAQANVPIVTQATDIINLARGLQAALGESDLLVADMTQRKFPDSDKIAFAQLATLRQQLVSNASGDLLPAYRSLLDKNLSPAAAGALTAAEARVIATTWRKGPPPPALLASTAAFGPYAKGMSTALTEAGNKLQNQTTHQANVVFLELILAAGLGLLGTIASIALSLVVGRGLVRQLRELRESALRLANDKLPAVISQLRAGQPVDTSEYAAGEHASGNEIEQVQYAFNIVQQTAVQTAIDEARLRRGISDVFRNLAGRSQSLLHRQLTLLDGMERRATEPDELEDLFRIDHLTTRMRRHAEGLIILSGEAPARGWRQPVPLIDVLRAAVAEVEDYTRIRVLCRTQVALIGPAVADVIHLIAELAENATIFSPPNAPVRIHGDVVGRGFAVEIEDRGLGIAEEKLAQINHDLANPPQFDLSDSDRLGLFIAGQLARRHDITITLQPSVYGGTTAIVLIPLSLVVDEDSYAPDPALPAGSSASQSGRHAALAGSERGRLAANGRAISLVADSTGASQSAAASLPSGTLLPPDLNGSPDPLPPAGLPPSGQPASPSGRPLPPGLPSRSQRIGDHAWLSADPPSGPLDRIAADDAPADPFSADPFHPDPFGGDPSGLNPFGADPFGADSSRPDPYRADDRPGAGARRDDSYQNGARSDEFPAIGGWSRPGYGSGEPAPEP